MRYLKQLALLMSFWALGEILGQVLKPFMPIPGTILGMLLLFIALSAGWLKERQLAETSDFLLGNIAFFFIPACISILKVKPELWKFFPILIAISILTTILTLVASALGVQGFMKRKASHE